MSEQVYDEEIAPLLLKAAEICRDNNIQMCAQVEYAPGEFGSTFSGREPSFAMMVVRWAMVAKGNADTLIMKMMEHERGRDSKSICLRLLSRA